MFKKSGSTETQRKNGIYETRAGRNQAMRVCFQGHNESLNVILTGRLAVGHHQTSLRPGLLFPICQGVWVADGS